MASLRVLAFDHEARPVQFDTWLDDLQLYLLSDSKDSVSLFDLASGAATAPPATADSSTRSQWRTRDAAARLAIRNHLPLAECAHFGQHRTAQALYDAEVARYSSPATAALGRLLLPYLFPELSSFATVEDLVSHLHASDARYCAAIPAEFLDKNPPSMYITLFFIVTRLNDYLRSVRDHLLSLDPTSLTVDLLEQHLLVAETSAVADVGAASASAKRRNSKGKGGRGCGGGSGGGGGGCGSGGGGSSGGGGGGGSCGGSGGSGGGGGVSGGSGGSRGGGTGSGGTGAQRVGSGGGQRQHCPYLIRTGDRAGQTCGRLHTQHRYFSRLDDAWRAEFGDDVELPRWADLRKSRIAIFDLDFDAILFAIYALSVSAEDDCYLCVPPDPGIAAAALGASESGTLPGTAPAQALHTFMLDSGASRCFFRDSTTLTPLPAPVPVRLADPSGGPVVALSSTVLPCPAVPSGSLSGLHVPSFSTNLVSTAALQDAMVTTTTPGGQRVSIYTCTRTCRHMATFTHRPGSSIYTLATEPSQVAASAQVSASGQVAASCSCRLLSHQTLLWHHCLGHPSLPHLRGMHSCLLVSGLPRSLPSLPPSLAPPCLPYVEGRQHAAPHSSSFPPMTAPLQTLHMDVWGPARVSGQSRERYFLLVVDDYTRYTTVFSLCSKGQVIDVLIPWIRTVRLQLRERFGQDLPVLCLLFDRSAPHWLSHGGRSYLHDPCGCSPFSVAVCTIVPLLWPFAPSYLFCGRLHLVPLLWHHRLGHPSLPHLRGMHSRLLVSGLPRSLPPLPPSPALPCLPCVEGRQRAAPHSSFPPTTAPLQTLHLDVWGPARVSGQSRERYFLLVVDDYSRYTTVFRLRSKGQVVDVLIPWIRTIRLQLRERFGQDLPVLCLHSDRGGEFSSNLLRDFCRGEGILQTFMLPSSPQQNGIAERRIGLVMEVGDALVFRVWGSCAFVRDTSADKLSPCAIPCVFLGFVPDAPGWQFYHPTSRRVFPSQEVTFDESVSFYRLFPYCSAPPPPPPLFLAPDPPLVDPLPPQGPAPSGVSQVDPLPGPAPVQVAVDSGAASGASSGGAASGGAEPGGAESEGAETGGAEPGGAETGGAEPGGVATGGAEPGGAEPKGVEPGGAASEGAESGGAGPQGAASSGATGARGAGTAGADGTGVAAGVGVPGGAATTGSGGACTRGTGAAGTGGVEGARAGDLTESGATGACGTGVGGPSTGGAGVGGPGVGGARAGGAGAAAPVALCGRDRTSFPCCTRFLVPRLLLPLLLHSCVPRLTSRNRRYSRLLHYLLLLRTLSSPAVLPSVVNLRLVLSRLFAQLVAFLVFVLLLSWHARYDPSPAPPASDHARAASPTVSCLLATAVTDPSFESAAASALVAELLDFATASRLDYTAALVAESASPSPPSVGGESALGTDVLEDRQEEYECLAAAVPRFASMLLAPEGDPDAPNIPTPRSYAEGITGPYSSQWQAAMDAKMASWKSTGTYVNKVPPPGANIVDGMWIFRGVDYFQTFSPTPKMTTLRVLLHAASQRDHELHSLDFSTSFLHGSLHEEIFPCRTTLVALGFAPATADPSLFLRTDTSLPPFYILVYVNDLVFATADTEALTLVKSELQKRHTYTDLDELRSYLGLQITRDRARRTITLTQSHMVLQVLQRFGFQFSSPQPTPLSTSHSLSAPPLDESVEPTGPYPELLGCLMYLMMCTRPDLAYPLSLLARYVAPGRHRKVHWDAAKRLLCYLCSTSGMGLVLGGRGPVVLSGHADASWVDDSATQRSSQGYTFSLGSGSVSWRSTRSSLVLSSSCEAEIYAGAMAALELRYLTNLLIDLGEQPRLPPHRGQLRLAYVATRANTADIFTKALPPGDHQRFVTVLGLVPTLPHLRTA
ncbi:unnamed protein product [Closterium sp. NIES-53]